MRKLLFAALILVSGCQPQVFLMPTPEALRHPDFNLFEANPNPIETNSIKTLYATTREPADSGTNHFTSRKDVQIHLGYANVMIGTEDIEFSSLIAQSTTADRWQKFAISLSDAPILGSTQLLESFTHQDLTPEFQDSLAELQTVISSKPIGELTIYVHGASNIFYRSIAQGSMFQYFSGNNAPVLTFAWPSPGTPLRYGMSKRMADESALDLANFIELLALHTSIEQFNLLAYSAGGRTVAGALVELGRRYQDKTILRLGEVYFAQSDQPLAGFLEGLPVYFDLVEGVTVSAAPADGVLRMARMTDGEIRLGAASEDSGESLDLSPETADRLAEIFSSEQMAIIDLTDVPDTGYRFTHGAWYDAPWVSTDVMISLLGGLTAAERGLVSSDVGGVRIWRFPHDYVARLRAQIQEWRREQEQMPGHRPDTS